jgi:hypothetical protein
MRHLAALEIHAEIDNVLGQGSVGYLIIRRYLRKQSFPRFSEGAEEEGEIGSWGPIDRGTLQALNEQRLLLSATCEKNLDSCDNNSILCG